MELARYVVDAVVLEERSYREVARAQGVSKSWVAELVARYREGGYEAVAAKSKAAKKVANRTRDEVEDTIVRLRKELTEKSFDAGAQTIHYHLSLSSPAPPSTSTIWRVLKRRGFVPPQPHKRPRSSYVRFEAALPNETWQADVTFFSLANESKVEILNFLDDFSRVCVASKVLAVHKLARRRRDPLRSRPRLGSAGIASHRQGAASSPRHTATAIGPSSRICSTSASPTSTRGPITHEDRGTSSSATTHPPRGPA